VRTPSRVDPRTGDRVILSLEGDVLGPWGTQDSRLAAYALLLEDSPVFSKATVIGLILAIIFGITLADCRFEDRRYGELERITFYALWILLPLGVYMATGTYSARSLYLPAVGVAATLAGFVDAVPAAFAVADSPRGRRPGPVMWIAAGAVVYFLAGSMMLSSPAVSGLGEWPSKSRLAQSFLEEFDRKIGPRGPCGQIIINGLPDRGTIGLEEYSVQSWIHLRYPEWDAHVKLNDRVPMTTIPDNLELRAGECIAGELVAQVELP
jgi:hypothetical protein